MTSSTERDGESVNTEHLWPLLKATGLRRRHHRLTSSTLRLKYPAESGGTDDFLKVLFCSIKSSSVLHKQFTEMMERGGPKDDDEK